MYFLLEFLIFLHRNSLLLIYLKSRSIELFPFVIVCSTKPYSFASALTDFPERCKFTICFLNSSEYLLLLCTICNTSFLIQKFNVSHFMCPLIYTNTSRSKRELLNWASLRSCTHWPKKNKVINYLKSLPSFWWEAFVEIIGKFIIFIRRKIVNELHNFFVLC